MKKIHKPILSRFDFYFFRSPGPGLGNLMFPLARSYLLAQRDESPLYIPTLFQLKLGTILRREKDLRLYWNIRQPRRIQDLKNYCLLLFYRLLKLKNRYHYEIGLGNLFLDFTDNDTESLRCFFKILARRREVRIHEDIKKIGIHLRGSDFSKKPGRGFSIRLPKLYYEKAIQWAKAQNPDSKIKIIAFWDGCEDYKDLIKICDSIDESGDALNAIISLSCCDYIVCSRSTFSLWSAFLSTNSTMIVLDSDFDTEQYIDLRRRNVKRI